MSREITARGLTVEEMRSFKAEAKAYGGADKAALAIVRAALRPKRSTGFAGELPSGRAIEVVISIIGDEELTAEDKKIARHLADVLSVALAQSLKPTPAAPAAPATPAAETTPPAAP